VGQFGVLVHLPSKSQTAVTASAAAGAVTYIGK